MKRTGKLAPLNVAFPSACSEVWDFLLLCQVPYCSLYDVGYTSIGNIHDTIPNPALRTEEPQEHFEDSGSSKANGSSPGGSTRGYRAAHLLRDGRLERSGRFKKKVTSAGAQGDVSRGGEASTSGQEKGAILVASVIIVGDEIL